MERNLPHDSYSARPSRPLGWWKGTHSPQDSQLEVIQHRLSDLHQPVAIVLTPIGVAAAADGEARYGCAAPGAEWLPLLGYLPPLPPEQLGDAQFRQDHGLKYAYMTGAMANGIASAEIVEAMGRSGMLGSFGAAGLSTERISDAIARLQATLVDRPYCFNLIHSPNEPAHEAAVAELYLRRNVTRVEASAYLDLTMPIVKYRVMGVHRDANGIVRSENRVIAKISRVEVATKFLSPPPRRMLDELASQQLISRDQVEMCASLPMCDDLIAEADSGGHTDNRPAITLLPTILALRDRLQSQYNFPIPVRVGLAGGIATPASVAGAFTMGAGFVVTGSVNQACFESGSSEPVRRMLAEAGQADVTMAPAADMFEMGVKVQVLKRGTMFAMRGQKLFDLYRQYPSWEAVPAAERAQVEKNFLRTSFDQVWADTKAFFQKRDPTQLPKAESDPKHKMALVFRWYLGLSSRWANVGEATRQLDYQVWCGPAMGAFNEWVKGTYLEPPPNRSVVVVARNLLAGAAVVLRQQALRQQGIDLPRDCFVTRPRILNDLEQLFQPEA